MINKNDIMVLNDVIYKIYTIDDFDEMRKSLLELLKFLIPYKIGTFYLAHPDSPYKLANPVGIGLAEERYQVYLDDFQDMDYTQWAFASPMAKVFRETDLMSEEARINTPFYKAMFEPDNIHYSVIVTIIREGVFYGCIDLFREKCDEDFSDEEIFILDLLKDHLAYRLFKEAETLSEHTYRYPTKDNLMNTYQLTPRETEILYLLLDDPSYEEICENLCISINTLKKHTSNIYKKMEVSGWRELIKEISNHEKKVP